MQFAQQMAHVEASQSLSLERISMYLMIGRDRKFSGTGSNPRSDHRPCGCATFREARYPGMSDRFTQADFPFLIQASFQMTIRSVRQIRTIKRETIGHTYINRNGSRGARHVNHSSLFIRSAGR